MWNLALLSLVLASVWQGGSCLLCACNTASCREQGQTTCNATAMCYVQYLDLGDGSDPLVRGCIASKTPLLCENRRPALAASWPVLVCCAHAPMCNKNTVPGNVSTTPPRVQVTEDEEVSSASSALPTEPEPRPIEVSRPVHKDMETINRHQQLPDHSHPLAGGSGGGLSATYAALLAVACSLLVLVAGAFALFLLRRRALIMASGHYGAMHGGYFKGNTTRDCADPEAPHSGLCSKRPPTSVAT